MKMQLRDYQQDIVHKAYDIITRHKIVYLAMEVRTGKTLTALSLAQVMGAKRVLLITKKKAIGSILNDYIITGFGYHIDIINFEAVKKYSPTYDVYIVDEAHSLGAFPRPSQRTQHIKRLVGKSPLILMSGTPSPESYSQLYHQFWVSDFSPFAKYKNFYGFSKDYVKVWERIINGFRINDYSNCNKEKISAALKKYFITYTQEEAGFMAGVSEKVISIPVSDDIKEMAENLRRDRFMIIEDNREIVCDTAVKLMTKLHQIYSGTVIAEDDGSAIILDTYKADYIKQNYKGKKIAIFYQYRAEGEILRSVFRNWTGTPEEFNADTTGGKVFLGQFQSGSMGTNLSTADVIIFYNINFSSLMYWQARARSQCLERDINSEIHWLFAEGGIEKEIYKAVVKKKDFTTSYFKKVYAV